MCTYDILRTYYAAAHPIHLKPGVTTVVLGRRKEARDVVALATPEVKTQTYSSRCHAHVTKLKKQKNSCEIEDSVETHLCKLCVIPRSRELRVLHGLMVEGIHLRTSEAAIHTIYTRK